MSKSIAIAIEGLGAHQALEDFLTIPGIQGTVQSTDRDEVYRDGGLLVAVGAIVGIAVGVAELVSKIIDWRDRLKKDDATHQLNVVLEDTKGNRIMLDRASPEQIADVLQALQG
ncbi:MAG TPA: hypothetical protein VEW03_16035 [Longimicrobiaceae bacterium]|nr:hypothetical protein [Longimicrobiaceae bacterium]